MRDHLVKNLACALAGWAALWLAPFPARADDRAVIEELRSRMEALEKQNHDLRKALEPQPTSLGGIASGTEAAPATAPGKPAAEAKGPEWFEIGKQLDMRARWDNGIWFLETADRAFRIHVGGRTQFDVVGLSAADRVQFGTGGVGPVLDGVNFRRARLEVDGTLYDTIDFWCEYDFLNTFNFAPGVVPATAAQVANTPAPTDLWVTLTRLPWIGNLRIGNQKQPISFEHLTSSRFLNFMERSLAFDAFIELQDNGFRPGIQAFNWIWDERATWAIGIFSPQRNVFGWNVGSDEFEITGRVTALPVYLNDGRCLIHVGLGASHIKPDEGQARARARTLLRNGPASLHTIIAEARVLTESQQLLVPEFAMVWGPLEVAAEFYASWQHSSNSTLAPLVNRGTTFYHGCYVEALYFLTGEHRLYNRRAYENRRVASFDRVIPHENFFFVRREDCGLGLGTGAWQVGARYSYIDLQDKGIGLGVIHDLTLGVNWFWNANMKVQFNYLAEHRDVAAPNTANGWIHGVGTRLAFDF